MKHSMLRLFRDSVLAVVAILLFSGIGWSQGTPVAPSVVVTACGTPPTGFPSVGRQAADTENTSGLKCVQIVSSGAVIGTVYIGNTVVVAINTGSVTDKSGAITLGGTAQTLAASNTSRKALTVQNMSTATLQNIATAESLFISFTGTASCSGAAGSLEIPTGSTFYAMPPISTQAVSVCGATTNHRWYAGEQ